MVPPTEPLSNSRSRLRVGLFAIVAVAAAAAAGLLLDEVLPVGSLALLFVCAVLAVALRAGKSGAAAAALLSAVAYNFLFTEPRYTLRMSHPPEIVAVAMFFVTALAVGHLASRQRAQLVELRRATARLEAERQAGDTERLRTALLSSVSHDLRTPLSAVLGAATTLAAYGDTMSESDRTDLVESIRRESERLDRYIQNLLDMTRLGAGPLRLERDWVGVDEVVAAARDRLRRAAPERVTEVEIEPGLPALYAHPALLEQALYNVLENASRFSPAGAPVLVRARREGSRILLEVVDRGPGIAPAERERIFDRFYTAGGPGDGGTPGSGLGLTIVRGMVGAHGGTVEAREGDGGVGTTVRMAIPLVEPPADPEDEEAAT